MSADDITDGLGRLDLLARRAVAAPVRPIPERARLARRVALRRRHRRMATLAAVVALLVPAALGLAAARADEEGSTRITTRPTTSEPTGGPTTTTDPAAPLDPIRARDGEADVTAMAPSPLAAREAAATAWTGSEMVVWGGHTGEGDGQVSVLGDGAVYDPAADAWRSMAPGPLVARERAAAVWTGEEVLVWGGSEEGNGVGGPLDGAAYDPVADSWRSLAPAPVGSDRVFPSMVWVGGRMVVGGGATGDGRADGLLTYDPATDAWAEHPLDRDVVMLVAAGDRVAVLSRGRDGSGREGAGLTWFTPVTGAFESAPDHPVEGTVDAVGGVWTGTALVALATTADPSGTGTMATIEPGAPAWHDRRATTSEEGLVWPVQVGFMSDPALVAWAGDRAVSFGTSGGGLTSYDPATGEVVSAPFRLAGALPCGYDAAIVWTGDEVLAWGGQSCRADGSPQVATGARLSVPG